MTCTTEGCTCGCVFCDHEAAAKQHAELMAMFDKLEPIEFTWEPVEFNIEPIDLDAILKSRPDSSDPESSR